MENDAYKPLATLILPRLGTKFCDLPDDVRARVKREFIVEWDALSPEQRTAVASQHDLQHDPAMEKENAYWESLSIKIGDLKNEIAKWDAKPEPSLPSESILKERKLDTLRARLAELESRWKLPPFSDGTQSQSEQPQPEQFKTPPTTDWRRNAPMEKVPQSYLANTDAVPATLSLLPLDHSGHAKIKASSKMSATASVSDTERIQVLRTGGKTLHSLSNRRHVLDSIVAMAINASTDKSDYQAVWAAYVKIAKDDNRPPPLLGYVEGEGVKYASDTARNCIAFDSKRAFAGRFRRRFASC